VQVAAVVFLGEETGLTIVPSLHDVQRDTIKVDAVAARYERMLANNISSLGPFNYPRKINSNLAPFNLISSQMLPA
jgi:hypothetical protein